MKETISAILTHVPRFNTLTGCSGQQWQAYSFVISLSESLKSKLQLRYKVTNTE